ncbi:hypothetical protein CALCODRAFT_102702 [Calocera cornea HHB12733]|uniref:Secreted protein n=1 Tax=Calocera cornea HHB12733 TaxID=1353952 RepID=A0A165D543_9BASI|nr:hypothetical protein CALCODRAFT_102702 [Calocera cornea HHB12733]
MTLWLLTVCTINSGLLLRDCFPFLWQDVCPARLLYVAVLLYTRSNSPRLCDVGPRQRPAITRRFFRAFCEESIFEETLLCT